MTAAPHASCAGIVVAAGRGERLGGDVPKSMVPIEGRPLVVRAVDALVAAGCAPIVVVHAPETRQAVTGLLAGIGVEVTLVAGADTRSGSVRAGLAAVPDDVTLVAVHDAARGLQPATIIADAVAAIVDGVVAAAPAMPVTDTLKTVDGDTVVGTVDRDRTVTVQTPQVFDAATLREAHGGGDEATDDLALVERVLSSSGPADGDAMARVVTVPGSVLGLKVTHPADLVLAAALLRTEGARR